MLSKIKTALEILHKNGPSTLANRTLAFLARETSLGRQIQYYRSVKEVRKRMDAENGLVDILNTVLDIKPGYPPYQIQVMQIRDEIRALTTLVEKEQPQSVLEIGTAKGGSFYIWSRHIDSVDKIISLDLPGGRFGGGYDEQKTNLFRKFDSSKEMHFIRGNSHKTEIYQEVSKLTEDGIDFLFIDGDHTYEGVKQDFEMYSELVSDGRIIALHDIVTHPDKKDYVENRRSTVSDLEEQHLA